MIPSPEGIRGWVLYLDSADCPLVAAGTIPDRSSSHTCEVVRYALNVERLGALPPPLFETWLNSNNFFASSGVCL